MSNNRNGESGRRKSFFETNEEKSIDYDLTLKKLWESKFGPEDMDLVYGVKYPEDYIEKEKQKTEQLTLKLAEEICLKKKLKMRSEENPQSKMLVDDGILTLEQRMDILEIEDKINTFTAHAREILDRLKIYEALEEQQARDHEKNTEIIDCLVKSLF